MSDNADFVSKSDLQVFLASFEQKLAEREVSLKKEFEVQANQIHSSYAKKLKKLGVSETVEDEEGTASRKPSKHEMELQSNLEKLVREIEETKTRAKHAEMKQSVSDQLLKSGINPKAVDTVYTLLQARNALVEGEDGALKLKVNVEGGANVALPVPDALKHFVKSDEGQLFMAPIGADGSGSKTSNAVKTDQSTSEIPEYRRFASKAATDWRAVSSEMGIGNRDE